MGNQLVTLQQACRNALAAWLVDELAPVYGGDGVVVEPRWFEESRQLPPRTVTIIDAGQRSVEWLEPDILAQSDNPDNAAQLDITWQLGAMQQPLQLDVWAPTDVELDDIIARLDRSLNAGERGVGLTNVEPFRPGLLLDIADGWDPGRASFLFDQPSIQQTATSVGESEWRATYRGRCDAQLVQTATTAKLARVHLKTRLRAEDPVDTAEAPETTTITLPVT